MLWGDKVMKLKVELNLIKSNKKKSACKDVYIGEVFFASANELRHAGVLARVMRLTRVVSEVHFSANDGVVLALVPCRTSKSISNWWYGSEIWNAPDVGVNCTGVW